MPVGPTVQPSGEKDTIKTDASLSLEACGRDSSPDKAQRSNACTKPQAHLPVQEGAWTPTEGSGATWMPQASAQPSPEWAVRCLGFPPGPDGRAGAGPRPVAPGAGGPAPVTPGCRDGAPAQSLTTGCTGPGVPREGAASGEDAGGAGGLAGVHREGGAVPTWPQPELLQATPGPPLCPPVTPHSLRGGGRSPPSPRHHRPPSRGVGTVPQSEVSGCEVSRRAWHTAPWWL